MRTVLKVDLQYADIDPSESLYHRLVARGRMRTLFSAEQIERAQPKTFTRETRVFAWHVDGALAGGDSALTGIRCPAVVFEGSDCLPMMADLARCRPGGAAADEVNHSMSC